MATYNIYSNAALSPGGFFPIGVNVSQIDIEGNGRDYMFTLGGETRIVRVYWDPDTFNIYAIGLYVADEDPHNGDEESLGEILEISISLTAFETMWLDTAQSAPEVFAFIFNSNDRMEGNDAENTFVPGLGNDEVFGGGDNSVNDYDYVNYAADDRQHGITVDLVDGNAADDVGKVTSRGGVAEADILHSINSVYATAHADLLIGDNHDNEFYAGFGNDTIQGGDGSADNFDVLSYNGPEGRTQGITVTFTAQGAGTVASNEQGVETDQFTGIEAVHGTAGNDRFTGSAGFQRFRGFKGDDTFDGGAGGDEVDYRSDTPEVPGQAGITVDLSSVDDQGVVTVEGANGDIDTLISIERIRGTRNNDSITGSNESNRLRGDAGDDAINGLGGDDRLEGGNGNDSLLGGNGQDLILGEAGNDTLNGGDGFDTLDGGTGNDVLIGSIGQSTDEDYFVGSLGNDSIYGGDLDQDDDPLTDWNEINYNTGIFSGIEVTFTSGGRYGAGTVVKKNSQGDVVGTDQIFNVHAVRGTSGEDSFTGANSLGNQRFVGLSGADIFDGTNGINEIDYRADARAAGRTTGMVIDLGTGTTAEVEDATGDIDTLISIERIRGTDYSDQISGNGLDNRLRGDAGNDLLNGRDGDDRLEGGAGWDTLDGGSGNDLLIAGIGGNGDEDVFLGSAGNDTIHGGEVGQDDDPQSHWNEINYYDRGFTSITVTFGSADRAGTVVKTGGGGGTDTFYSIDLVRGTAGDDTFIGGTGGGSQRFIGLAGDDTFDGSDGINEVDYRAEARVANRTTGMVIDLRGETDATVIDATGDTDTLIAIERVRGTEYADAIHGNELDNRLRGDAGNDTLDGGAGNDILDGGAGNDTAVFSGSRANYHVTNVGTRLTVEDLRQVGGEGTDAAIDVEFFNFGGTVLNLAEVINHGSAINLAGGMVLENSAAGADIGTLSVANPDALSTHSYTLISDAGGRFQLASDNKTIEVKNGLLLDYEQAVTHTVVVRATDQFGKSVDQALTIVLQDVAKENTTGTDGGDTVSGGSSTDNLSGGGGNDNLNGGGGKDKINGGTGNDRIIGGSGQDSLTGGSGKDVFAFGNKDTGTTKTTADYITDFSGRGGDKIDLKLIDADTKKKGDQAFSFIGKNAFSKAGQVRYEKTSKETYVYLNTDSDKAAEGVIKLKGALDLQKGWFVL